mmetsp:Transcript_4917/g.11028  ORF Transcript_4917/g.11028 Transcript_4917/m.11028 type:complete len:420 (-) Transcript_4917:93-1352(-)
MKFLRHQFFPSGHDTGKHPSFTIFPHIPTLPLHVAPQLLRKKPLETNDIPLVQLPRIRMTRRHHLRKIDQGHYRFGFPVVEPFQRLRRRFRDGFSGAVDDVFLQRAVGAQGAFDLHRHARVSHVMFRGVIFPVSHFAPRVSVVVLAIATTPAGDLALHATQIHHQIKLVQIAVDQPVLGQPSRQLAALTENLLGLRGAHSIRLQLIQRHASHQPHGDHVTILRDGSRGGVPHVKKRFHEGVLLEGRSPREEEPRVGQRAVLRPVLLVLDQRVDHEVVPFLLHVPKGRPAQPVELEHDLPVLRSDGEVHVRLLPRADPISQPGHEAAALQVVQGEDVVAAVGEAVAVVAAALVVAEELVAEEGGEDFGGAAVAEVGEGIDEGDGDEGVGFHARFDGGQHSEVGGGHGAHYCWVQLHGDGY